MIATRSRPVSRTTPTSSRVLFATDGSPGAELAERLLGTIVWPRATALHVVCVIPRMFGFDRSRWQTGFVTHEDAATTQISGVRIRFQDSTVLLALLINGLCVSS